ncbi:methyltransferase domain-containing protein [Candidatus Odyssella thessalonicensis]|uniref:methyltransferase domain-containing protein n=1 Tax=Candidatus Odyssella thessalonicensis TaxID=84647 RepID=UPI000225B71E|nr:methyltransferase domain-containing protein [Candidatus Odyssella thessalonicensis]
MKSLIREHFSRAAATYNRWGLTQQQIAAAFARQLQALPAPTSILEIGCGTGFLSHHLGTFNCRLIISDLSPTMVNTVSLPQGLKVALDGEYLPFCQPFDWIVGSLAFQWFESPERTLPLLKQQCKTLAFTTLGPNNFHEWKDLCRTHNLPDHTRPMLSAEKLRTILGADISIGEAYYSEQHPNWLSFWQSIHKIGAHTSAIHKKTPVAKSLLRQGPITCSYHVLTVICR